MPVWDDVIGPEEQQAYEKAGWGGRVGFGARPALVVIDMYNAFVDPEYPFSSPSALEAVAPNQTLLEAARGKSVPVFYSTGGPAATPAARGRWKATGSELPIMKRPDAYEIYPDLRPAPGEPVIVKTYPSAFFGTTLISQLIYHRVDTLIVTGTVTSGCVRGTCLDAFNYNFRVIVPEECVCDRGQTSHKVALFEIHMKYGDVVPLREVLDYLAELPSPAAGRLGERK